LKNYIFLFLEGTRGAVGWGTAVQAGRSQVPFPVGSVGFFKWLNPSGSTTSLGSAEPLREMSTSVQAV